MNVVPKPESVLGLSIMTTEPPIVGNPCDRYGSLTVSSSVWLLMNIISSATVRDRYSIGSVFKSGV